MPSPRERMVISAALLIRERGAQPTAIADVLQHSGAPRGSAYHYFPGGRTQLLCEAIDLKKYNEKIKILKMISKLKSLVRTKLKNINQIPLLANYFQCETKSPKVNLGQIQAALNCDKKSIKKLADVEFQVFSQFGDDGIIQWLINELPIPNKTFIEFGVENYREANTRFLLINNY